MNLDNEPFQRDPSEVTEFDLKSEIIALSNILHQLDHRLEQYYQLADSNNAKLELLEEAVSHSIYLPYLKASPKYDHKSNHLVLGKRLVIPFKGNEAELLSHMFVMSSGNPKRKTFYFSEAAKVINKQREKLEIDPLKPKALHSTAIRVKNSLELEYKAGSILTVTTKEFYFNLK